MTNSKHRNLLATVVSSAAILIAIVVAVAGGVVGPPLAAIGMMAVGLLFLDQLRHVDGLAVRYASGLIIGSIVAGITGIVGLIVYGCTVFVTGVLLALNRLSPGRD